MFKKWICQLFVLTVFLLLLVVIEKRYDLPTVAPLASEQTLTVLLAENATTLDPARASDRQSAMFINNIYEGLVRYKPNSTTLEPALATKWEVKEQGKVWIFSLREGVKFHDNTPFNAEAVKFSVERVMADKAAPYGEMVFGMVERVEVLDDYNIKFVLKYPYAPFIHNLAMPWAAPIVSPTAVKNFGADFAGYPVGTGPFKLAKGKQDDTLVLTANEQYWQQPPKIKRIVLQVVPDAEKRYQMLAQGEGDMAIDLTHRQVAQAKAANLTVVAGDNLSISYMGFYNNKPPFNNGRLRRAMVMAVDREKLVEKLYGGTVPVAENYLPPNVAAYSKELNQYPYNPQLAKELLAQNGYPQGMTVTLICYQEERPYNLAGGQALAAELQRQLAQVGITLKIKSYRWEEYKEALKKQEGHCFLYGWIGDNGDADKFLYPLLTSPQIEQGLNLAHYKNAQVDRLLASAQQTTDEQLRQQLYYHTQQIILQEAPWLLLSYGKDFALTSPAVQNLEIRPVGGYCFYHISKSANTGNM